MFLALDIAGHNYSADHTSKSPVSDPSSTLTMSLSWSPSPFSTTLTTDNKKQPSSAEYMNFQSVHTPLVRRSYSDPQQFNSSEFSKQLESDEMFSCSSSLSCSPSPPFSWPCGYGNSCVYEKPNSFISFNIVLRHRGTLPCLMYYSFDPIPFFSSYS